MSSPSSKPRIACIIGTRPDAIKTAPVILRLHELSDVVEPITLSTGQHREMLDQVLTTFSIKPDDDLGLMRHGQTLAEMSARALEGLDKAFERFKPDFVMAQGDTTTTFIASLAAFYRRIPYGHIEAGLRTGNVQNPFPEEFNRVASAIVSEHHYAPTHVSAANLAKEGYTKNVFVTGNTGIDAVFQVADRFEQTWFLDHPGRVLLLTAMHKNPIVRESLEPVLGSHPRARLIEPPEYEQFVKLMQRADLILSDSGGVQEEAPAFGIPVLVLRDTTERPEGVTSGASKLIGTDKHRIVAEATDMLNKDASERRVASPYGDGKASRRICAHVLDYFGIAHEPEVDWTEGLRIVA